jgi:transcriptional regulator with XRE-family HTH domain
MKSKNVRQPGLAAALAVDARPRYIIAALAGMNPNTLGGLVSGRVEPTARHKEALAEVLGVDSKKLWS